MACHDCLQYIQSHPPFIESDMRRQFRRSLRMRRRQRAQQHRRKSAAHAASLFLCTFNQHIIAAIAY
jgi:hypothetical protein